jgi:hypothetical protein
MQASYPILLFKGLLCAMPYPMFPGSDERHEVSSPGRSRQGTILLPLAASRYWVQPLAVSWLCLPSFHAHQPWVPDGYMNSVDKRRQPLAAGDGAKRPVERTSYWGRKDELERPCWSSPSLCLGWLPSSPSSPFFPAPARDHHPITSDDLPLRGSRLSLLLK